MIRIATHPKPSRPANDDIAGHAGNVFWLMDGATQLEPPAHGYDACWHVGQLARNFQGTLAKQPDIALTTLAKTAIENTASTFFAKTGLTAHAEQKLRPLCTLILCRMAEDHSSLDYLIVCDSTLAIIGPDRRTPLILSDDRLERLNPLRGINALLRGGSGFASDAFKAEMHKVYAEFSAMLNNPDGWDAIAQDASVIDRALTGTVPLKATDHILLMSDGLTRTVDTLALYKSWNDLHADLMKNGTDEILKKLRAAETADANGQIHPRSSLHDDATLLWISP